MAQHGLSTQTSLGGTLASPPAANVTGQWSRSFHRCLCARHRRQPLLSRSSRLMKRSLNLEPVVHVHWSLGGQLAHEHRTLRLLAGAQANVIPSFRTRHERPLLCHQ